MKGLSDYAQMILVGQVNYRFCRGENNQPDSVHLAQFLVNQSHKSCQGQNAHPCGSGPLGPVLYYLGQTGVLFNSLVINCAGFCATVF